MPHREQDRGLVETHFTLDRAESGDMALHLLSFEHGESAANVVVGGLAPISVGLFAVMVSI